MDSVIVVSCDRIADVMRAENCRYFNLIKRIVCFIYFSIIHINSGFIFNCLIFVYLTLLHTENFISCKVT